MKHSNLVFALLATTAVFAVVGHATGCKSGTPRGLKGQTNATMTFYGKAVDQDGAPLPDVKFEFLVEAYPNDWTFDTRGRPYDRTSVAATSDANGLFQLNITGCMVSLGRATIAGYRQLEEMDGSDGPDGNSVFTRKIGLISWSDPQYKSVATNPAVYVFVKDGVRRASTLPCKGGTRRYNKWWIENQPAWPRKPSLPDVDWVDGQARVNVSIPLVFKTVDVDGNPLPNVILSAEVERYRTPDERPDHYDPLSRTSKQRLVMKTGSDGVARAMVTGFRFLGFFRAQVESTAWGEGPFLLNASYARELMDRDGNAIYRCDDSNPMVLVMVRADDTESRVMPCRGGYERHEGRWRRVEPEWPESPRPKIGYRAGNAKRALPS